MSLSPGSHPTEIDVSFRPAWPDEVPRAARLFSGSNTPPDSWNWFAALVDRPVERLVGAAAWAVDHDAGGIATAFFEWRLLDAYRGTSVETEFLESLAGEIAGASDAATLRTTGMIPEADPASDALRSAGFEAALTNHLYRASFDQLEKRIHRLRRAVEKRSVPVDNLRFFSLTPEFLPAVEALVLKHGLLSRFELQTRLESTAPDRIIPELSAVMMHRDTLAGVFLVAGSSRDATLEVLARIVEPGLRRGPASLLLVDAFVSRAREAGPIRDLIFRAAPDHSPDTERAAFRHGGEIIGRMHSFQRPAVSN